MSGVNENPLTWRRHFLHGTDFRFRQKDESVIVVEDTNSGASRRRSNASHVGNKKFLTLHRLNLEQNKGSGVTALSDLLDHSGHKISGGNIGCRYRNNVKSRQNSVEAVIVAYDDSRLIGRGKSMIDGWNEIFLTIARSDFERHERDGV